MTAEETVNNVEKALDEIRPFLMSDGGNIKLLSIENDIVRVQFDHKVGTSILWVSSVFLRCTSSL